MKRVLGICLTTGMFAVFANVLVFSSVDYVSAQADAANKAAIDARLTERRNRIKPTLTAAEKVRVAGACVAAQAKAKAVLKQLTDGHQPYQTKVDAYIKRLKELEQKLKTEGKDTTEFSASIVTLDQKYAAYKAAVDKLTVTMSDLTAMDCKTEPNGFKATLTDARTQIKEVMNARKDVNAFAKNSIVKALQKLKGAN